MNKWKCFHYTYLFIVCSLSTQVSIIINWYCCYWFSLIICSELAPVLKHLCLTSPSKTFFVIQCVLVILQLTCRWQFWLHLWPRPHSQPMKKGGLALLKKYWWWESISLHSNEVQFSAVLCILNYNNYLYKLYKPITGQEI